MAASSATSGSGQEERSKRYYDEFAKRYDDKRGGNEPGGYHDLGEFVSDVAQMPRIVTLNDIAIEAQKDGSLKFDATAVTYRYLDDEEVAKLRKEKAKEKAGNK